VVGALVGGGAVVGGAVVGGAVVGGGGVVVTVPAAVVFVVGRVVEVVAACVVGADDVDPAWGSDFVPSTWCVWSSGVSA